MRKPPVFVGIDPGEKGAICALRGDTYEAIFIPTNDHIINLIDWFDLLGEECDIRTVTIEKVASLPKVSAKSNFNFGYNVGVINAVAATTGCMVEHVPPKTWQKFIGVVTKKMATPAATKSAHKKAIADIASSLYPASIPQIYGPKGGLLDGKSDALMIAHYAMKNSFTL